MSGLQPCLEVDDLEVRRGRRLVVTAERLRLGPGTTAVVGPNGSGKSSLLRVLATVEPPATGRLLIAGSDPSLRSGLRAARRSLGYLPQAWDLPAGTRVIDAVRHGAWLHRVGDVDAVVDQALEDHDLAAHRVEALARLSGGTHRRVAIAQASLHRPAVLLLDEPTAGLDLGQRRRLWAWIRRRSATAAVLVVTHDVDEVVAHADAVVVVARGRAEALPAIDEASVAAVVG
jgi:ABC-type multidrug transport system ATPase subunit